MTHDHDHILTDDNPIITYIVGFLRDQGAVDQADATRLLPALEATQGPLTDRERTAVLARFPVGLQQEIADMIARWDDRAADDNDLRLAGEIVARVQGQGR